MNGLRSVVGVGAGFFTTQVLALGGDFALRDLMPEGFGADGSVLGSQALVIMLICTVVFGIAGGYVASRIGQVKPVTHAAIVGAIVFVLTALQASLMWSTAPAWYHLATVIVVFPAAVLGGMLLRR